MFVKLRPISLERSNGFIKYEFKLLNKFIITDDFVPYRIYPFYTVKVTELPNLDTIVLEQHFRLNLHNLRKFHNIWMCKSIFYKVKCGEILTETLKAGHVLLRFHLLLSQIFTVLNIIFYHYILKITWIHLYL